MIKQVIVKQLVQLKPVQAYYGGVATIFMLHRVGEANPDKLPANENMKVSAGFLDGFIQTLLDKDYDIISLDELYTILVEQRKVKNKIVFTFDDGYEDNLTAALPIFEKYNVPFTIYLTTSFPDRSAILWWYALEDILLNNNSIILNDGIIYCCKTIEKKQKVFLDVREKILKLEQGNFFSQLKNLFQKYEIDWLSYTHNLTLSWKQVVILSQHPLVTIAGHTLNHYTFNQLSASEIAYEVKEANRRIQTIINKPVEHFAYPFGSTNEVGINEYKAVKCLGLKTVTTTRRGNVSLKHLQHLEALPRVMLTNNFDHNNLFLPTRSRVVTL